MREWLPVPLDMLRQTWPAIEGWMLQVCEASFGKYQPQDFLALLESGDALLWVANGADGIEAAAITDIVDYPHKRYGRITVGMGSNPQDTADLITTFEAWAKAAGCHGVQSDMRLGFSPPFKAAGWKQTHVLFEKEF